MFDRRYKRFVLRTLHAILSELNDIRAEQANNGAIIMAKIEDVIADIQAEETLIGGVSALITGLRADLKDALANQTIPAEMQAKIDEAFAKAEKNKAALAAALATTPEGDPVTVGDQGGQPVTDQPAAGGTGDNLPTGTVDAATGQPVDDSKP